MQIINTQIRAFLEKETPTDATLTDFINNLSPQLKPTLKLHEVDPTSHQLVLVYAHLMVQDMRETYYYYSFIMKRPFKADQKFMLYRWGNQPQLVSQDALESPQYMRVMIDRDQVVCNSVAGLTEWAKKIQGDPGRIDMYVDGKSDFKLGQIVNVVAFYHPEQKKLYYVRRATQDQVQKQNLNPLSSMVKSEVDFEKVRHQVISFLCQFCSETFAEYLLLTLLSDEPIFLGADSDISQVIEAIYPRVQHLKLTHPCEESLFPYKNEQGEMISAPLQLSNESTFVSIDFTAFSQKDIVQIGDKTIQNFKALKVFIEERKTIYRWQFGESHLDHRHRGVIVKASSFLTPDFHPKDQEISQDFSPIAKQSKQSLAKFRQYIAKARTVQSGLLQEQRIKIEEALKAQTNKQNFSQKLGKVMQLSKLIARSYGRSDMLFQDFERGKQLISYEVSAPQTK